jgi:hypothetical protein
MRGLVVMSALLATGCYAPNYRALRAQSARDLQCPESAVSMTPPPFGSREFPITRRDVDLRDHPMSKAYVQGCRRHAYYVWTCYSNQPCGWLLSPL